MWPARPVRLVVPAAPGGPISAAASIVAEALGKRSGQRVQIQHVPGDGTVAGALAVARSPADGHHLGLATSALAINAALRDSLPYDTLDDLAPVSLLASFQYAVFAHRSVPVTNAAELVAHAQGARSPLPYASPGIGTGPHVAMESFAFEAGIRLAHRPFESAVAAERAVLSGALPLLAMSLTANIAVAMTAPLRPVMLMGRKVATEARGVSWASDMVGGFEINGHLGVIAPRGVPAPLLARIGREMAATVRVPDVRASLGAIGMETSGLVTSDSQAHLRADIARWRLVGRVAGIRLG